MKALLTIIARERNGGCHDGAMFGGFAAYLRTLAERAGQQDLARLADLYAIAAPADRLVLLRKSEEAGAALPDPELGRANA